MRLLILAAICLLVSAEAGAQGAVDRVSALDKKCETAREAKLKPIRAQKIAQCIRKGRHSRSTCRIFYSTYGNNSNRANGSVVRGHFYDLPQCVAARKALDRMRNRQNF